MNPHTQIHQLTLVTGAAGGIGEAIVVACLKKGGQVCATDRTSELLEPLIAKLSKEFPNQFSAFPMDVEDGGSIKRVQESLEDRGQSVGVLINNAGFFQKSEILQASEEVFQKTLNVNLVGPFRTSQTFIPGMIKNGGGKIINIASVAALKGAPGAAHYASSKAGLVALSQSLACELAPKNIQVNTVLPGYIETPMTAQDRDVLRVVAAWRIPNRRLGLPEEVAEAVCFLAFANSSYLTGSQIVIDGGFTLA